MFEVSCRSAWGVGLLLLLGGCDPGEQGEDDAGPAWMAGLPLRTVAAAAGETVWAAVPRAASEAVEIGTYRVESIAGAEIVLADGLGRRFEGVPGALVHPVVGFPEGEMGEGTVILGDRWDARKVVGRVAESGEGGLQVAYDWNGATTHGVMDSVLLLPASGESLVLRWVAYRPGGGADGPWYKGLVFAESGDRVWISDDAGFVEVVARESVKVLEDLDRGEHAVGAAVAAYSWGHGYRPGVIEAVLEPGLRYAVELEDGRTRAFFFEDLTTAL